MADKNKIKYGLANVWYARATLAEDNSATYETPVRWPGAVNLSMDPSGELVRFYADDIVYWAGEANNGYEGDFESALVPDSFKKDIMGYIEDANGVLVEPADMQSKPFALMFEFKGDKHKTRHVLYNCAVTRPSISGATKEDTIEPQTESVTLQAGTIYIPAMDREVVKASSKPEDGSVYAGWNSAVYQPSPASFEVIFASNGGSDVPTATVPAGSLLTEPTAPTRTGYTFAGWYSDPELTEAFVFTSPIEANMVLYAKWTPAA